MKIGKKLTQLAIASLVLGAGSLASGAVIFSDDFESGNMNNWTQTLATAGTNFVIDNTQNIVPIGGQFSAKLDSSGDRMHNNILADNGGVDVTGASTYSYYIYDPVVGGTTATRLFNEVRGYTGTGLPDGGITANGTLAQLLAGGKFNTVNYPGEVFNANKYQGRITFGPNVGGGWFNLDLAGTPNRSVGWHKFTIERLADETLNFYVDDVLGRTFAPGIATVQGWDTLVMGLGAGTTAGDSWTDGVKVETAPVPEPAVVIGLGALMGLRRRRAK